MAIQYGVNPTLGEPRIDSGRGGDDRARPRTRRSRQRLSRSDKVLVGIVVLVLAVLAAIIGESEPTAVPWIDAVERFIAVGVVGLAGMRARRWSLIVGASVVTIFGSGFAMAAGFVALLVGVVLTFIDRRSRVVGAALGGTVALFSMFLSAPGPLGVESILGVVATLPIVVSGYRVYVSSKSARRRRIRLVMVVVLAAAALCLVATGVAAAMSWRSIKAATKSVEAGLSAAERGDRERSEADFRAAKDSFVDANRTVGSFWASTGKLLPGVGANLSAVQAAVDAGEVLTDRAGAMVGDLDYSEIQLQGGGVDLAALADFGPPLESTSQALRQVDETLSDLTSPWLLPPLAERLEELSQRVGSASRQSDTALLAVEKAPAILGADGPRRYLFLFGNPAEMRDLGGHLGNWAEVVVDNGKLHLVRVGGPLDLAIPADKAGGIMNDLTKKFPASLVEMRPTRFPHNWSSSRDLPTVAKLATELFPVATGQKLDGVVYADVKAFAALLRITGPVKVPFLEPPVQLDQANAVEFLTRGQFELFATESLAGDALEELIQNVFDKLVSMRLPDPQALGETFAPLVSNGSFRMATVHSEDTRLLTRLGLFGAIHNIPGRDMLTVINRNAGPSKIDSYLSRRVEADITWNPETGGVESMVSVKLHNGAPASGLNRTIYGNDASVPDGTNLTDVAVLTPLRLQAVSIDGSSAVSHPQREGSYWRYTVRVEIPPGGDRVIIFDLDGTVDPGPQYVLSFNGQSLLNPGDAVIRLKSTVGRVTRAGEPNVQSTQSKVKIGESLDKVLVWRSEGS